MKFKIFILTVLSITVLSVCAVSAQEGSQTEVNKVISAFTKYKEVTVPDKAVPTVLEIPLGDEFIERTNFAVLNTTEKKFEPYLFQEQSNQASINLSVQKSDDIRILKSLYNMMDGNTQTYTEFSLPEDGQGRVQLILTSSDPITSSRLTALLDNHVALPSTIEIHVKEDNWKNIVLAERKMTRQTAYFPETTSKHWVVTFTYGQPLRITEIFLTQKNVEFSRSIRFLAQPNNNYKIYLEPDRYVSFPTKEAGNLSIDKDVVKTQALPSQSNPFYVIADIDKDDIPDVNDNCVSIKNPDQIDVNNNGRGDKCDDFDKDGILNVNDNCPKEPNRNQTDTDSDGIGDACDEEESRLTEKYKWFPWVGIGFATLVLVVLLFITLKSMKKEGINLSQDKEESTKPDQPEKQTQDKKDYLKK